MTSEELKNNICRFLDAKKAADITILDVERLTVLADYFIVAGGSSTTNVRALAEYVEEKMEELGVSPIRKEGVKDARWVVYDYGNVILHILMDDMRLFYSLEKLWSDGKNFQKYVADENETDAAAQKSKAEGTEKTPKIGVKTTEKPTKTGAKTVEKAPKSGVKTTEKTSEKSTKTRVKKVEKAEKPTELKTEK
jgi:ribosome-associated protein